MKAKNIIVILIFFYANTNAQYNSNWVLGLGIGPGIYSNQNVSFLNGTVLPTFLGSQNRMFKTSTCISDTTGNLLYYTNGQNIYNALGDTMDNGDSISPSSWNASKQYGLDIIQGVITMPMPGSDSLFYLIHQTIDTDIYVPNPPFYFYYCSKLYFSIIDKTPNGGLGKVIKKNINILGELDTITYGGLTCCRHANGRDWWLMSHGYHNDIYYRWLISPSGIAGPYKQNIGPYMTYGFTQCKFSSDGTKYAATIDGTLPPNQCNVYLYNFDRCTGLLSDSTHLYYINPGWPPIGLEFSPNSKYLYSCTGNVLYQWDILSANIQQSILLVDTVLPFYDSVYQQNTHGYFCLLEMAADNKIYACTFNVTSIFHAIMQPDLISPNCNFQQQYLQLNYGNIQSIPNTLNFGLGADVGSVCDTLTNLTPDPSPLGEGSVLYPNPANDKLNIVTDALFGDAEICIYNLLGEKCFSSKSKTATKKITLDVSTFKQGLYLLQLKTKGKVWSKKFFKE